MLEKAIDLIGEEIRAVQLGDRHQARQLFATDLRACRAVRKVDDDHARVRSHRSRDSIDIERPIARIERNERHVRTDRPRHLVQRLIRRPDDHRVIAGREHRVQREEHALLGAGKRDDVVRVEALVQGRDLFAQRREAERFGVPESEPFPAL